MTTQTFPEYLSTQGLRVESIKTYASLINNYLSIPEDKRVGFLGELNAPNTRNLYQYALRHYYKWQGITPPEMKSLKTYPKCPSRLTKEDVNKLKGAVVTSIYQKKAKALFCALISSGMRISELLSLKKDQLGPKMVINGKGGKERIVFMHPYAIEAIKAYVDGRGTQSEWIFCKENGEQLTKGLAYFSLVGWARAWGIKLFPHQLRHTYAQELLDAGCDLLTLQGALGHSNIATTSIYLRFDPKRLEKFHGQI